VSELNGHDALGPQAEYGAARDGLLGELLREAERLLRSGAQSDET
jgi:hypothetical protein